MAVPGQGSQYIGAYQDANGQWLSGEHAYKVHLPKGAAKANWVQTKPGLGWFVYLRLYGPEKPYFEKKWIPGDMEKLK